MQPGAPIKLPEGHTIDDYGFGLVRSDGKTPRPTYDWLLQAQVNQPINAEPVLTMDLTFEWPPDYEWEPVGYEFEPGDGSVTIKNVRLDPLRPTIIRTKEHMVITKEDIIRLNNEGITPKEHRKRLKADKKKPEQPKEKGTQP